MRIGIVGILLLVLGAGEGRAITRPIQDATARAVEQIRERYAEIGRRIELGQRDDDSRNEAGLTCTEIVVNRFDQSWPAVGTYSKTVRFYYDLDEASERHFPDRLVKVEIREQSSARRGYSEFLFDDGGELVFFYARLGEPKEDPDSERRIYLRNGRAVRFVWGATIVDRPGDEHRAAESSALEQARQLRTLFERTTEIPSNL